MVGIFKRDKFLIDIGIYMFSTSVNQAIPFLLLPVLTIYLIPSDFGYVNNFSTILVIMNAILGGGLVHNIEKYYFRQDQFFMNKLMGNLFFILFCSTIIVFMGSLALALFFEIQFIPESMFVAIPFISFFFMSFELLKTWLKIRKQALFFSVATLSEVLLNVSLSLFLVIGLLLQWKGRVYGMIFSYLVFGVLSFGYLIHKKYIQFSINRDLLKKILTLSLPLLPSAISVMVIRRSGILFIDVFQGKTEAGLYGVGLNMATIILFISVPFIYSWNPHLYERLSKNNKMNSISSIRNKMFVFTLFIFSVCILVSFFSGFILRLMTTETFLRAAIFIPWLVFGFAFWAIRLMYMPFFIHHNRQKYIAIIDSVGAGLNIVLNYFAAKNWGGIGVAIAFLVSNCMTYLLTFFSVRTFTDLPMLPDYKGIYIMIKNLVK